MFNIRILFKGEAIVFAAVVTMNFLLCISPGRRPGTAVGGERARPGGGHSILGLPQDLHILSPESATLN